MAECTHEQLTGSTLHQLCGLEAVDLRGCNQMSECAISYAKLTHLKHLNFSGIHSASKEAMTFLISSIGASLEWLSLEWCYQIEDETVDLISGLCRRLQHLDLCGTGITSRGLSCMVSRTSVIKQNLLSLRLSSPLLQSYMLQQSISEFTKLEILAIENCGGVTDRVLEAIGTLERLQGLCLHGCDRFSWGGLVDLLSRVELEWLDLRMCWQLKDKIAGSNTELGIQWWTNELVRERTGSKSLSVVVDTLHDRSSSHFDIFRMNVYPMLDEFDLSFRGVSNTTRSHYSQSTRENEE